TAKFVEVRPFVWPDSPGLRRGFRLGDPKVEYDPDGPFPGFFRRVSLSDVRNEATPRRKPLRGGRDDRFAIHDPGPMRSLRDRETVNLESDDRVIPNRAGFRQDDVPGSLCGRMHGRGLGMLSRTLDFHAPILRLRGRRVSDAEPTRSRLVLTFVPGFGRQTRRDLYLESPRGRRNYLIAVLARSMSSTTKAISVRPFFDPKM